MQNFDISYVAMLKHCWTNSKIIGDLIRHDAHVTSL